LRDTFGMLRDGKQYLKLVSILSSY